MKNILILSIILLSGGCASIKWALTYQDKSFCICATVDSLSFTRMTSGQVAKSITESKLNMTQPMIDTLARALEQLKVKTIK